MLVLTRKSTESIMIGDDVEVTVLAVAGDKVRVGITAPRDVAVFRREVYLDINEARQPVTALPIAAAASPRPALTVVAS